MVALYCRNFFIVNCLIKTTTMDVRNDAILYLNKVEANTKYTMLSASIKIGHILTQGAIQFYTAAVIPRDRFH